LNRVILYKKDLSLKLESRKEYKFLLTKKQIAELFNVFENKIETLYPKRVITSLYMDTVDFSIYNNSIFLDVNKFKVRYRTYSSDNSIYEEIKTNTMNGKGKFVTKTRFKSFDDISNKVFKKLLLKPSLMVEYERSYYKYKNLRITVDEKLNFTSNKIRTLSKIKKMSNLNVVEYKLNDQRDPRIEKFFITNPEAFSKYIYGVNLIYKNKI
tara:strand:+ start:3131 stop:3763 length:633 start_codon:yes stop_codon:yes gene_type:complete